MDIASLLALLAGLLAGTVFGALLVARRAAALEAQLEAERCSAAEKVQTLRAAQAELVAVARQSAGEALEARGRQLLDTLKGELRVARGEADAELERRQRSVEETVAPVRETLARMQATLEQVDRDRRRTHGELTERLRGVVEAQRELRSEAGAIVRALRQPHTRGRWGELHLRRLTEVAGMSALCDITEQGTVADGERSLRPDMVVHLPGDKDVVVDAKAPLVPYLDACEALDETAREMHLRLYARALRGHVRALAGKDYAAQFPSAPDFVVLYLPGEHFFAAALEADPALIEDATRQGVLIATPTTLIALLKTVAQAWQQEKVEREAVAIAQLGRQLHDRLVTFLEHIDLVGRRLNSTVEAHNRAVGSLERMVLPTARRFPELGAVASERELATPRQVLLGARAIG